MNDATMTIRTDSEVKKEAEQVFNALGFTTSTAINMFLRQVVRQQRIPFDLALYNNDTLQAIDDIKNNRNLAILNGSVLELLDDE